MNDLYSIHDTIRNTVDRLLMDVHTTIPAKVLTFDNVKQTVKVEVAVNRPTVNGKNIPAGTYHEIPMIFPSTAKWIVGGTIDPDDIVLLVVPHYGTTEFMSGDGVRTGDSDTVVRHDMNDAVAIPGLFTQTKPRTAIPTQDTTDSLYLAYGSDALVILKDESVQLNLGATQLTLSASGVDVVGNLTVNGIIQGTVVQTPTVGLATHTHTFVDTGTGAVGASVTAIGLG